ncbi:MAG TPA: 2'-5' RNA ligase family protein [Gemmatimonadaceae bacterium]|nr:2'-5' RNA ligase family protein [Gemmatimonadaceae bacterium]
MSRPRSGIFVIAPIGGDVGERIAALQRRYDPRLARLEQTPHVTLAGSSGMGPIAPDTPLEELDATLGAIAEETAPITLRFGRPTRFMQTQIVVLPLDPHGPLRALHERIKTSGLRAARPRFYFTPHVTLNLYRELPADLLATLLAERFDVPITLDTLEAHLTRDTGESKELGKWGMGGVERRLPVGGSE